MNILTVGASPYLLTKSSKINRDILLSLKEDGHNIASAVWHNDITWFMNNQDDGTSMFEDNRKKICSLYPFIDLKERSSPQMYEIMKKFQPDIVITIGDYDEIDFIYSIKALYPDLFKWVAVLTIDALPINDNHKQALEYIDIAIVTTKKAKEAFEKFCDVTCYCVPYGPDHEKFFSNNLTIEQNKFKIVCCSKNSQTSNLSSVIRAVGDLDIENVECYLHTNLYDQGDYDLYLLVDRYGKNKVKLPEKFVGLNDGLSEEELRNRFISSDVVIDASVRSGTGLTLLEAMACGCVPVATNVGAIGEIMDLLPGYMEAHINSNTYVGKNEEEYEIISTKDLTNILYNIYSIKRNNVDLFKDMKKQSIIVAEKFSNKIFLGKLKEIIEISKDIKNVLLVKSF